MTDAQPPLRAAAEPAGGPTALPAVEPVGDMVGDMELYDLRVTVVEIHGRSVCGMAIGDYFDLTSSAHLTIPAGRHFCVYALQSVLPMLPAKQRALPADDWLEKDTLVCCPDPEERLVMRIDRTGRRRMTSSDLT